MISLFQNSCSADHYNSFFASLQDEHEQQSQINKAYAEDQVQHQVALRREADLPGQAVH